jgi:hypothetical protein
MAGTQSAVGSAELTAELHEKLDEALQLLREIRDHVAHCPTLGVREVFDKEFGRKEAYDESSGEIITITTQGEP